jgi:glutamate--cysteine ligase
MTVPHLTTSLSGPIQSLEQTLLDHQPEIEAYLRRKWSELQTPIYGSVDLRMSGFKLAPVDANLFPGGFNNLNKDFHPLAVQAMMAAMNHLCGDRSSVLLVPENHTRNPFYLENIGTLHKLLTQAGVRVRIGTLIPEITTPTEFVTPSGVKLIYEPLVRTGDTLSVAGFDAPCTVLLNNDLSAGIPEILKGLNQHVLPPVFAGWSTRSKSMHFDCYESVAHEVGQLLKIDPWLINPLHGHCGMIDFKAQTGLDALAANVETLLAQIQERYDHYGIKETPFLIVKADAGTYGMGVMTVKSVDDVRALNRDARKKMAVVKEGMEVHKVIIQEGVYTQERVNDAIAEPVVYMVDQFVVGGFYRVHAGRGVDQNLNAPGAQFVPLAFEQPCTRPDGDCPNRFYAFGVVARLALVAAAMEIEMLRGQHAGGAA